MNREQVIKWMKQSGAGWDDPQPADYSEVIDAFFKVAALAAEENQRACEAAINRRISVQRTGCTTEKEAIRCLESIRARAIT